VLAAGEKELSMQLGGRPWKQDMGGPQKYHGKSLKEIRRKFTEVAGNTELVRVLERCGCMHFLVGGAAPKHARL
jgi:hypothetical protein